MCSLVSNDHVYVCMLNFCPTLIGVRFSPRYSTLVALTSQRTRCSVNQLLSINCALPHPSNIVNGMSRAHNLWAPGCAWMSGGIVAPTDTAVLVPKLQGTGKVRVVSSLSFFEHFWQSSPHNYILTLSCVEIFPSPPLPPDKHEDTVGYNHK